MPNQLLIDVANALKQASVEIRAIARRKNCTEDDQFAAAAVVINQYLGQFPIQELSGDMATDNDAERQAMIDHISDVLTPMGVSEIVFGEEDENGNVRDVAKLKLHPAEENEKSV
jgi:hypothetical protein